MTTGIIALAVPGSVAFAGEFLILAGVYGAGWGWAAVGAGAIVLAAMYMLRLISAVLHPLQARTSARSRPTYARSSWRSSSRSWLLALPLGLAGFDLGASFPQAD